MKRLLKTGVCLLLAVTLCFPLFSCAKREKEEVPAGMQAANVEGDLFRLYVPTTWKLNNGTGVAGAYYTSAKTSGVTVRRIRSDAETLDAFYESCMAEHRATYGERLRLDATDVTTLGGEDAKVWTFTAWTEEDVNYKVLQCAAKHDGAYYLLTYAADPSLYETLYADVQKMVKEFRFADAYVPEKTVKKLADVEAPAGMKIASDNLVPYRFFIPDAWTVNQTDAGTSAYFSESDRSNVSVTAYVPDAEVVKLDDYYEQCMKEYADSLAGFTKISCLTTDQTMGGRVAQVWEFTAKVGGETYHYRQTVITYNSLFYSAFYTLTYTATEEHYAEHLSDVDAMVAAFQLR